MKFILAVLVLGSTVAHSQQQDSPCPNPEKLEQICSSVNAMDPDDVEDGSKFKYFYQRQVSEASCVDSAKDTVETQQRKISDMWSKYEDRELVCSSLQFDVVNGSIIKYAAFLNVDAFIRDVIRWKVNLNKVDASDGKTLLDYVQYHMERTRGGEIEKKMKYYYELLKKAGAKHKSEL